ncbi:MAG: glycogen/starch synthase, partial [Chloroflexota bacterium]
MAQEEKGPPLRIMYVSAEVSPFAKVGGLADVAASLPKALATLGHDVRLVTPDHGGRVAAAGAAPAASFDVAFLGRNERVVVLAGRLAPQAVIYFIGNATYFSGERVYGAPDDLLRYHFFCRAVLELPKVLDWRPDVINCNDWHTALIPFGLRNRAWNDPFYRGAASALTIHNLGYRGPDDASDVLSQGIFYAGVVSTVSPTYAREITTPEFGQGLHTLLQL